MRLIDADALGIGKCNPDVFENKGYADGWNTAIEILQSAPTVEDAVVVVRCKDCIYYVPPEKRRKREVLGYCAEWGYDVDGDGYGYCYLGERKSDNG